MRKPFDVLAEGLPFEKCRGDRTAIELFVGGIRALTLHLSIGDIAFITPLADRPRHRSDTPRPHRAMKPTHAGPLRASVRPAARGGDFAATSPFCGTPSTPRIRQKKP